MTMAYDAAEFLWTLTNKGEAMTLTPPMPRARTAAAIQHARRCGQRQQAIALRDAWAERMAICIIAGGLSEAEAERIAADEVAPDEAG
jgi:hypothetical protein